MPKPHPFILVIHSLSALLEPRGIKGGANHLHWYLIQALCARDDVQLHLLSPPCAPALLAAHPALAKAVLSSFNGCLHTQSQQVLPQIKAYAAQYPGAPLLFSDALAPFGHLLLQSHSRYHRRQQEPMVLRCLSQYRLRNVLQREAATFATTHQRFFFTVSAHMKRGYENQFSLPSQQVKALYPGVNLPPTLPQQAPKAPNVLGIVNSRSLNKGGWLLLLALWCLKRQHPQAMLYMVHPKWSQDALSRALVGVLGLKRRVKVLPFQKDMTAFYEAIDYLVLPSLHEAFGLVGLEAMAHGVPAVVSSTAGVAEVVTHGENGFVFHRLQQPVKALANTLHTALTQSPGAYAALQQGAVATAQRHSWQGFAQGLLSQLLPLKESSSHA